jgi:creatinine amidohydrolase/Fe(II)-dependent formamide hydrolase-like protein
MKAGWRTAIVPTGGTEKNGYHMTLGKHNVIVEYAANQMARRLGNTLVAPVIQYVPEGNPDRQNAGAISLPSPAFNQLLDAAARSLKAHGFREILLIGDSGGNQAGLRAVADALNEEWKDQHTRVYALTDYYEQGRLDYRAWMQKELGFDDTNVGSHAGISDTSQLLFVKPDAVRKDRIKPWGGAADSGVSGDPTKATAAIGKAGIDFKVEAGIRQLRRTRR